MLKIRESSVTMLAIFTSALLNGCGGGGGGAPAGPQTFPLQSAYKSYVINGKTVSGTISGSCSGTGTATNAPATTAAAFEGVAGFSSASTGNLSFTNCTPATVSSSGTSYFNSSYVPLGDNYVGNYYGVYLTPPIIPTSVIVGTTGVIGTETLYTDSTKATGDGRTDSTYVIEADTSTTAIVNLISKTYNAAGTLTSTEQDRYRIAATGALTPVSADIQYANGSTTHLIWIFN